MNVRLIHLITLLTCTTLLVMAYYIEIALGIVPCPLCMLQRICFILIAMISLVALIHMPRNPGARRIYGIVNIFFASFGSMLAIRQLWLQHSPEKAAQACVPGIRYIMQTLPFADALKVIFSGTAECARVTWTLLGMSMAVWSLLFFVCIVILMLMVVFGRFKN